MKRDSVSTSVQQEMKWAESRQSSRQRRHSAFAVSYYGRSAGQIVVAPAKGTVPAIAQTQSREWAPREERSAWVATRAGGLHRAAAVVAAAVVVVMTAKLEESVARLVAGSPQRLQGGGCRKMAVS